MIFLPSRSDVFAALAYGGENLQFFRDLIQSGVLWHPVQNFSNGLFIRHKITYSLRDAYGQVSKGYGADM